MAKKTYEDNLSKRPGEIKEYRDKPYYAGYEDDSVSGRAAAVKYQELEKANPSDMQNMSSAGGIPYDPNKAKEAQAKQREVMNERRRETKDTVPTENLKKGGSAKKMASGGKVRGCGIAQRGKTKGRMV